MKSLSNSSCSKEPARKTRMKGTAVYLALSMRALLPAAHLIKRDKRGILLVIVTH